MFGFALYKDLNNLSHEITSVVHCNQFFERMQIECEAFGDFVMYFCVRARTPEAFCVPKATGGNRKGNESEENQHIYAEILVLLLDHTGVYAAGDRT